jgi:hypothetical protein
MSDNNKLADEYLHKHASAQWAAGTSPPWLSEEPAREPQKSGPEALRQFLVEELARPTSITERLRPRRLRTRGGYKRYQLGGSVDFGPSLAQMCRMEETEEDVRDNYQAMRVMMDSAIANDRETFAQAFKEVLGRKVAVAIGACRSRVAKQMAAELEEGEGK